MSVFAGALAFDGAPAGAILPALAPAPPGGWDHAGQFADGPCGMAWGVRWTTPEAVGEQQPARTPDGRLQLVYSGRVDNRDELIERYARAGAIREATDSALLLAVISRDGVEGLRHVVGDFALAVWEPAEGVLWLARDAMGQRPLFVYRTPRALFWSTDLGTLASGPARGRAWRRAALGDYLCWHAALETGTLVDGVERILPATWMRITRDAGAMTSGTYWAPPVDPLPRCAEAELVEDFRVRFTAAVAACLRVERPPASQLSGGLDSSLVTALAARASGRQLDTYSLTSPGMTHDGAGALVDESRFIDAVVAWTGVRSVRWDPRQVTVKDIWRLPEAHGLPPDAPNGDALQWRLVTAAAADGHRVMLTGLGGDFWLTGSLAQLPARLSTGDWRGAWRFVRDARGVDGLGATPRLLAERIAAWLAPGAVKAIWRRRPRPLPPWLSPDLAAEVQALEEARERSRRAAVAGIADLVRRDDLQVWIAGEAVLARELVWRTGQDAGVEIRHPFADRRVAEFVLRLPDDLRFRGGRTRYIQRAAFASILPPVVRDRCSKGEGNFNAVLQTRRLLEWPTPLEAPRALVDAGLVRPAPLVGAWRRARHDASTPAADLLPLFFATALERCLQHGLGR